MLSKSSNHNQTQFSAEEPFFEQPIALPQEERAVKPTVPFFKRRKTIIVLIACITVVLLIVLYVANLIIERNRRLGEPPDVTITPPAAEPDNQYLKEVEMLQAEWKEADPAQLELLPPAVDFTIRLDAPSR